jgi:serine/threonine protein kinase
MKVPFYFSIIPRLRDEKVYLGILETLETSWMRRCLARRRWYRLFNAVCVMTRVRNMTANSSNNSSCDNGESMQHFVDTSSEEDYLNGLASATDGRSAPFMHDIADYYKDFEKLHLIVNNGSFGTVYSVQRVVKAAAGCEVFSARHVRLHLDSLRREAGILYQLRSEETIVHLEGLYEGPTHSVLVTDYLGGGDLVERVSRYRTPIDPNVYGCY